MSVHDEKEVIDEVAYSGQKSQSHGDAQIVIEGSQATREPAREAGDV